MPDNGPAGLYVVQVTLDEANAYVDRHHRHSKPTLSHKWSLGAVANGVIVGVAIIGRPIGRRLQDGWTLEVLRVCTIGHRNACSFLYGASWRSIRALGFRRGITYTTTEETAASVRAAGWVRDGGHTTPRSWSVPSRPREDKHTPTGVVRWRITTSTWRPDLEPRPEIEIPKTIPGQMELGACA